MFDAAGGRPDNDESNAVITDLDIPDVKLIRPKVHGDHRGFFLESYNAKTFAAHGVDAVFVQDNHSMSREKGVVRGLHFQAPPYAQGKLVRVIRGAIFDCAVDVRKGSPTFGKHVSVELRAETHHQLWVPEGFAHGFCTLETDTEVIYKTTNLYAPDHDFGLKWNDPDLGIAWPVSADDAILSDKDQKQLSLRELPDVFTYGAANV